MKRAWLMVPVVLLWGLVACGGGDGNGNGDAAAADLPFVDDFETPGSWHTSSDPEVEIAYADGGLGIEVKVIDRVAWSTAGRTVSDGVVSVDATPVGGPDDNAYGLVVRHTDDRNFYRFEISSDGFYAVQAPTGAVGWEFLVDWTESEVINRGRETNRLKVEMQGPTMGFFVNDIELARVESDRYSEGDVGVIAGTFYVESGTHVLFDNFAVEALQADE
jgi:hypothetical protein